MSFEKVILAWRQAAEDLEIEIQSPFLLKISEKETIQFDLFSLSEVPFHRNSK